MSSRFFTGAGEGPVIPHLAKVSGEVGDLRSDVEGGFQRVQNEHDECGVQLEPKVKFTPEGGLAIKLINRTGAVSVKGTLAELSDTYDEAFKVEGADSIDPIGVVYDNGVADGDPCWIVVSGVAEVLLQDGTASTRGYWVKVSDTVDGRADATNAAPPGGTVVALEDHFSEVGHCLESKLAGTDVLARCVLHFN